ncbi:MAG: iron ABC transporter permease [Desulfuromonadaceae bacterium]|nr:iron ABC transporter permease [Desulfuromonadaceae bacterium]
MKRDTKSNSLVAVALCITSLIIIVVSVASGPRLLNPFVMDSETCRILLAIRLPRTAVALLMGGALGASGAILQGIFRNPLADPYILGISSGASLAASFGIMFGISLFTLSVPILAFIGALATGAAVVILGHGWKGLKPERLLLAGVGIGFFLSAVLMLVMTLSVDDGLRRAILWMSGDLSMVDWELLPVGLSFILIGLALALARHKGLNALTLGDDIAYSLGFNPPRERLYLFIAASLMTAASVSMGGVVGFIGLVVPHVVRRHVGSDAAVVLPLSVVAGGTLLCFADAIGRTVAAPLELPAGVIAALIGSPYFIFLLGQRKAP